MGYVPGQFDDVGDADLPGHDRYPFLNQQPPGDYMLEVLELRGFLTRAKVACFAADFAVLSGPEGAAPRVCFMATRGSHYYDRDIKSLANALTDGEAPDDINGAMVEAMCEDDQPAKGCAVFSVVYDKDQKTPTGELTGGSIRVNTFAPPPTA
jgi:hypothetical protein